MAQILESILTSLLQPDNAIIQQATAQLKEAVKDPLIIPALCEVLGGAQDAQIRQFAAVLLRRRLIKHWKSLQGEQQENLKSHLLEAIQREPEHKVRYALAQLSAVILKNEGLSRWPQFNQFVLQASASNVPEHRQVGLLVLKCSLDLNAGLFRSHFSELINLFNQTLNDTENTVVLFYTLQSLTSIIPEMGSESNLLRPLIPKLLTAVKQIMKNDEAQACEAMEVFDELMESEVSVVVHYIAEIINFCLEVAVNTSLSDNMRVKSLSCICFLIKLKSKSIVKQKLLPKILSAIFPIMCVEPPAGEMDPEDQEYDDEIEADAETQSPKHYAVQVVDMLALHLPPEKLFPQLSPLMEPCLMSSNPYQRKAGLMCLAVLSEGCADHIRNKHLQSMLQLVCQAISEESQVVRNAALFALGQFSENLQPDISRYSDTVLPLLLGYISQVDPSQTGHLTKAYYALENFVESLGNKIEPYLPTLMERILVSLRGSDNNRVKELAVSSLGAIANAAEDLLRPYFTSVMECLKVHLMQTEEDGRHVQIQCLETLGILVRTLGKETFLPLAEDCCNLGLNLCDRIDDPDLRRCSYSLFAALSGIMEDAISPHLEKITTLMLLSLRSREGIVIHYSENRTFMLFDDDEADEGDATIHDEDEYTDIKGFSVENSYIDEKEDACTSLGEIAFNASASFFPYLDSCFQEVFKHIECPHTSVRKAAYEALGQFVRSMYKVYQKNPNEANTAALLLLLSHLIPACLRGVMQDKERSVVMGILEILNKVMKDVKSLCVQEPAKLEEICSAIRAVLQNKTSCQDPEVEDEDEEQQAELDAMLIEHAGEGIPLVAAAVGGATFAPYFTWFLPLLLNKGKTTCSPAEKSFSMGTVAETIVAMGPASEQFVPQLFPALLTGARDQDHEVRSNSVFGLGVLVEHGGASMHQHFPKLLALLSSLITSDKDPQVLDNVCGAVCRMIMSNPEGVPIGQVFPVLVRSLPLKKDFEENTTVFKCIAFLYERFTTQVIGQINDIARVCAHVLGTKETTPETEQSLIHLLRDMVQRFPQDLQNAVVPLPPEASAKLRTALGLA
ncbi:importin-4 [Discoglossus pictus]